MPTKRNNKISNIQFVLSILIVLIHSSCLFINLPGKETQSVFGVNFATFIQLFFEEGICRVAVPLFMAISGYLFYATFDGSFKSYGNKLKRRLFSLVIPYLFWSALTFLAFYCAQRCLGLGGFFTTRNGTGIDFGYLFQNIILYSFDSPLWFCRYLIVFALISILVYLPLKKLPIIISCVLLYLCITDGSAFGFNIYFGLRAEPIFFYFFGADIALHKEFFYRISKRINSVVILISAIAYIGFIIWRSYFFCFQDPIYLLDWDYNPVLTYSGKVSILLGSFVFWFVFDYFTKNKRDLWKISKYSFLIFAAHHPFLGVMKKIVFMRINYNEITSVIVYFLSALITISLIIAFGWLVKKFVSPIWRLATGNRYFR